MSTAPCHYDEAAPLACSISQAHSDSVSILFAPFFQPPHPHSGRHCRLRAPHSHWQPTHCADRQQEHWAQRGEAHSQPVCLHIPLRVSILPCLSSSSRVPTEVSCQAHHSHCGEHMADTDGEQRRRKGCTHSHLLVCPSVCVVCVAAHRSHSPLAAHPCQPVCPPRTVCTLSAADTWGSGDNNEATVGD